MLFRNKWLPAVVLVGVVVFAIAAVAMLTGTITAAQQIEEDVKVIEPTVAGIDKDLDNVKLAARTNQLALRILDAAEPLSGQADATLKQAKSIDRTVPKILDTAGSINDTAKAIGGTVDAIHGNVGAINGNVQSIQDRVHSINGKVLSINSSVNSINRSVVTINGAGKGILGRVRSIDVDAARINRRARIIIRAVGPRRRRNTISRDLFLTLRQVGPGHRGVGGESIHGHANSIDCSPLVNTLRVITRPGFNYCGR